MCFLKAFLCWFVFGMCLLGTNSSKNSTQVCTPFPKITGLRELCGYNSTVKYKHFPHLRSAVTAVRTISRLMSSCSAYTNLIVCSVFIPRCVSNINGPYLPCRRVCDEFNNQCGEYILNHGLEWIIGMCQLLPKKDDPKTNLGYLGRCFEPPNFKTNITVESEPKSLKCYPLVVPICQNIGYSHTVLNTIKQKTYISYANRKLSSSKENDTECLLTRKRFFCTENFPACIDKTVAFYCRDKCEEFFNKNCTSPFFYDRTMCMEFPIGKSPVDICKQTHWPRAQNWPGVKNLISVTTKPTTETRREHHYESISHQKPTSSSPKTRREHHYESISHQKPTSSSPKTRREHHYESISHQKPTSSSPSTNVQGVYAKKRSTDKALIVGGVFGALFLIALALVLVYFIYKWKYQTTIPYDKQILYADDSVDI